MLHALSRVAITLGGLYLAWCQLQEICGYWFPALGELEGSARIWQSIVLGVILGGVIFGTVVGLGYRVLSYLLD